MGLERGSDEVLTAIRLSLESEGDRADKAAAAAEALRAWRGYRWVGVYEVGEDEVELIAFAGPGIPAHPRFPLTKGLTGVAVAAQHTIVSNDVSSDPRYLTAFDTTGSEMIVPIKDLAGGRVIGTIDVESDAIGAFDEPDRDTVERCAVLLVGLFDPR